MGWTDERVALLKKLWIEGLSASQIAKQLGNVTRNAVIGKVHRLGLQGRATPTRVARRPARAQKPRVVPVVAQAPSQMVKPRVLPRPVDVEALRGADGNLANVLTIRDRMCKWPVGEPGDRDFGFCGHPVQDGCSYCQEHARVAFQPSTKKKKVDEAGRARADVMRQARLAAF